jgi:hypothetical protein
LTQGSIGLAVTKIIELARSSSKGGNKIMLQRGSRQFLLTNSRARTSITTRSSSKQLGLVVPNIPSTTIPAFIGTLSSRNMSTEIKQISTPKATQRKHCHPRLFCSFHDVLVPIS